MNEIKKLLDVIIFANQEKEKIVFDNWIAFNGADKCYEIYQNLSTLIDQKKVEFKQLIAFANYDLKLSEVLFTLLRLQENHVKAFLSNTFDDYPVQIEARPSHYTKTKYYFKIPVGMNEYLDIRTFSYEDGPVDYYDAIKTIDFGDINLIMFHLPSSIVSKFSKNPDILDDLDKTRKLRNYVYHHNILYSLGRDQLYNAVLLVIRNLPYAHQKEKYINEINSLCFINDGNEPFIDINKLIYISEKTKNEILNFNSLDTF